MDVKLPNGVVLRNVPEGTPKEAIAQKAISSGLATEQDFAMGDGGFLGSKMGGLMRGALDPIDAAAQMLPRGLEFATSLGGAYENPVSEFFGKEAKSEDERINQNIAEYESARQAAGREGFDAMRLAGNVVSPANLAVASKIPAAMTLPGKLAGAAGAGAAYGALQPVTGDDFAGEKAGQVMTGAALGPAAQLAGSAAGRVINPKNIKDAAVRKLLGENVRLTPGQALGGGLQRAEDKLVSVPFVGDRIAAAQGRALEDLNRAAYQRVLEPLGKSAAKFPVGREGIKQVKETIDDAYGAILPKLSFKADDTFKGELKSLLDLAKTGLPKERYKQFKGIVEREMKRRMTDAGLMSGRSFKDMETALGRHVRQYSRGMADPDQQAMASALREAQAVARRTLERSNPDYAPVLKDINRAYSNYAVVRKAGGAAGAQEGFTAAQLSSASKSAGDFSVGKGRTATGEALMQDLADAGQRIRPKVANSGTADRLFMAGGTGALAYAEPNVLLGVGAAALPYTQPGTALMRALLARRPALADPVAQAVSRYAPALTPGLIPSAQGPLGLLD